MMIRVPSCLWCSPPTDPGCPVVTAPCPPPARWPRTTPRIPSVTPFRHAGGEWRLKYERAVREIDFTKKRLQQELEDKLEVEQQGKRQLERRVSRAQPRGLPGLLSMGMGRGWAACSELSEDVVRAAGTRWLPGAPHRPACSCPQLTDLQADSEESQRALQQLKKKCQRLAAELQDTKLHLEGQQGRNHDLEKKQRRWGPRAGGGRGDAGADGILAAWRASCKVALPF